MQITFPQAMPEKTDAIVIPVSKGSPLAALDGKQWIPLANIISGDKTFRAGERKTMVTHVEGQKFILLNVGPTAKLTDKTVRELAAPLYATLKAEGARHATLNIRSAVTPDLAAQLADALTEQAYAYTQYKTDPKPKEIVKNLSVVAHDPARAKEIFDTLQHTTQSVFWASNRVNDPPNALTPAAYATMLADEARTIGAEATVIEGWDVLKHGLRGLHAVGHGSEEETRLVALSYDGSEGQQKDKLVFVGKGITFDSGGLDLKDLGDMLEMKMDMAGSAAAAGAFFAAVRRRTTANIGVVLPLAENMPGGKAFRPTDVIRMYSGKTVEIISPDAEGRIVLADGMTYAQRDLQARKVVTAATLTGAVCHALALKRAGIFTQDKKLLKAFRAASAKTGENIWHLPMGKEYLERMTTDTIADIKNYDDAKWGGASTAAEFLNFFIDKATKGRLKAAFAHLDMAGPGMSKSELKGWGVRLLDEVIRQHEPR